MYVVKTTEYRFGSGIDSKINGVFKSYSDSLKMFKDLVKENKGLIDKDEEFSETKEKDYNNYKDYYCCEIGDDSDTVFECTISEIEV